MRNDGRFVWLRNSWILAAGIFCLLASFALGPVHFAGAVRHFFLQYIPGFPGRLTTELLALYWLTAIAGIAGVTIYAVFGIRRRDFLCWLMIAPGDREQGAVTWRELLLLAVMVNSLAFVSVRLIRDGVRTVWLQGLSFQEKKTALFRENPLEQNYETGQDFLRGAGATGGNIVVLRNLFDDRPGEYLRAEHLHFSAHLFPVRLYLVHAPDCALSDLPSGWLEPRGVQWVIHDCEDHFRFAPERIAAGSKP